ncbi:lytic murein transglycosylase [Nocardia sp. NBC_01730]|uniref:lytic transglycosylase domain-containing protein n=1 Tax=Nocardia sp. NBC_01730 TaxID=2975998 RepID=UPI002E13324F|nr:lytic murein transglycosylase [Nocardia sp. NBC_01730]
MRISAPITVSALVVAGVVVSGSAAEPSSVVRPPRALLAASAGGVGGRDVMEEGLSRMPGLLPVTGEAPRKLRALVPRGEGVAPYAGVVPLRDISLPVMGGALGIPEILLAAYRNAELALESSMPGCGVSWSLLAGIGRIESGHAGGGRTDAAGTTVRPIFGPALDGHLPGNEVIRSAEGGFVRAVGPMQFLPGTWNAYAADGNADGVADPNNVFDAALGAGKYLCSGGLNLRDPVQELRAVLRYNNSMAYAGNVLSWSAAYRTGGSPTQVAVSPELVAPGVLGPLPAQAPPPDPAEHSSVQVPPPVAPAPVAPAPVEVMIMIPGLPPIPCGIFCPAPPAPVDPCVARVVPAPMPRPDIPVPVPPGRSYGAGTGEPYDRQARDSRAQDPRDPQAATCTPPGTQPGVWTDAEPGGRPDAAPGAAPAEGPRRDAPAEPAETHEPEPGPGEPAESTPAPGITLPFGIVIPLPTLQQ